MRRPPLSAPGRHLPQQGWTRADIWGRVALFGMLLVVAPTGAWTLWLAGQVGGLLTHGTWPHSSPADAPAIVLHLAPYLDNPAHAWPRPAAGDVAPAWLLYPLWLLGFAAHLAAATAAVAAVARKRVRRKGFARRADADALLSAGAVLDRIDIVRPGLIVTDRDTAGQAAAKTTRRDDPLQVARLLGRDALSGQARYLANEYTILGAAAARFGGKTTRYAIPRVIDARGAVISTSTRLDVAEVTYTHRAATGPTFIFEPQGIVPGVPRLRWSPVEGAQDMTLAMLRGTGLAAGAGLNEAVENGEYFRQQAAMILRALLHAAALDEHATMVEVLRWSQNPGDARPERILRHHGVHAWADRLTVHRESTGRARDTIQTVVSGALDCVSDPRVLQAVSPPRGQYKPKQWLAESGTLYLVGTRDAQSTVAPLLAAISEDLLYHAKSTAFLSPGGRVEPALYFIGDEISNIAPLPSLPSLMSEAGGAGIAIDIYTQNSHQLRERWGDKGGRAIEDAANCRLIIGGSNDVSGLRDAQALAGQIREVTSGASWGHGRASVTENVRRENLFDLGQLRTLPTGRAIALIGNLAPIELQVPAWWQRHDAAELTAGRDAFRRLIAAAEA